MTRFPPLRPQSEIDKEDRQTGLMAPVAAFVFVPLGIALGAMFCIYAPHLIRWLAAVLDGAF